MSLVKRIPGVLMIAGLVLAVMVLGIAQPANAQLNNKSYTVDFFGSHINSPFDLVFLGTDCMEFVSDSVVCAEGVIGDCGPYTITSIVGTTIYFEADLVFAVGTLIIGPVTVHGVVDRDGFGSSMAFSFSGRLRSPDLGIASTRTNGSGHGVSGCVAATTPDGLASEKRWVRDQD